jgi:environmental stress-induced protein Ves
MSITLLPAASRTPQTWRNGGGVTFEVARAEAPVGSSLDFRWRVSIARVDRAGAFSSFAGFERLITVIEGRGMTLRGLDSTDFELRPFEVRRFDGAAAVAGLLPHGPVSDLNVIHDPAHCRAELAITEHALPERRVRADERLLINLGGDAFDCRCDGRTLRVHRQDALWLRNRDLRIDCARLERVALIEIVNLAGA